MSSPQQPDLDDPNMLDDDVSAVVLSPTQRKVAEMMCVGYSQSDMVRRLGLSEGNLKRTISEIYDAFAVPKEERKPQREQFIQQRLQPYLKATAKQVQTETDVSSESEGGSKSTGASTTPSTSPAKTSSITDPPNTQQPENTPTTPSPNTQQAQQVQQPVTLNPNVAGRARPIVLIVSCAVAGMLLLWAIQGLTSLRPESNQSPTSQATLAAAGATNSTDDAIQLPSAGACSDNILASPWTLAAPGDAAEASFNLPQSFTLQEVQSVRVTFNLHGLDTVESDSRDTATLVFDQNSWFGVTLTDPKYGAQDAYDGPQTITVPISDFVELPNASQNIAGGKPLDRTRPVREIHSRFWHRDPYNVEISIIQFCR